MDRGRKRATGEHGREDPEKTNVSVLILQQVSLFSNWWAAAEEKMSIGLAGRCVFSFAAAGAPGPPNMADFGTRVVLPVVKDIFRTVLKTVGPHAPLPTDAELLSWSSSTAVQEEVHLYRCLCHAFTKTLSMDMDETFATCLNKNGYWLSVVSFWNALLAQIWPKVLRKDESLALRPEICDAAVKTAMDFFTVRFLFGAGVLCADIRKRTWQRARKTRPIATESRWNIPAALLLKASCGITITPDIAARAAPMFRPLREHGRKEREEAVHVYLEALKYLMERGFGSTQKTEAFDLPVFVKWPFHSLPQSCKEQLANIHVHPVSFGLHFEIPLRESGPQESQQEPEEPAAAGEDAGTCAQTSLATEATGGEAATAEATNKNVEAGPKEVKRIASDCEAQPSEEETQEEAAGEPFVLLGSVELRGTREYANVREHVEDFLGNGRDTGVYSFHRQFRKQDMLLFGHCKKTACEGCTRHVKALLRAESGAVEIFAKGCHGKLLKPHGGALWTVAERAAINKYCSGLRKLSSVHIREALKAAKLPLRCTLRQLHNYVNRLKMQKNETKPAKKARISITELAAAAAKFQMKPAERWEDMPLAKLVVLQDMVVTEEEVCIIWTCKGMLRRGKGAQNKVVKLVVDGKQKILANEYTIVTVGFVVSSAKVTRAKVFKRKSAHVHTSTQEPFLQALVDSESAENMQRIFESACSLAHEHAGLELRKQVWQVHKDYAWGIEKARTAVFPKSRPCDDYPHMRRASYPCLRSFLKQTQVSTPQDRGLSGRDLDV